MLSNLKWKDHLGLSTWIQSNQMSPKRHRTFPGCSQRENDYRRKKRNTQHTCIPFKEGKGGHQPARMWATSTSWKRERNRFSHGASSKECSPTNILILAQCVLCWTSDLQKFEIWNLCLSLFVVNCYSNNR